MLQAKETGAAGAGRFRYSVGCPVARSRGAAASPAIISPWASAINTTAGASVAVLTTVGFGVAPFTAIVLANSVNGRSRPSAGSDERPPTFRDEAKIASGVLLKNTGMNGP